MLLRQNRLRLSAAQPAVLPSRPAAAWLAALVFAIATLLPGPDAAPDNERDPVAQWAMQRVAREARFDRLPHLGPKILIIPIGDPPPTPPEPLTGGLLQGVIEKLVEYSGSNPPESIDAVLFEINAAGPLPPQDLDTVLKLTEILQIHDYPVFAWVRDTALDEAAWVALACDRIYTVPRATLGGGHFDPLRDPAEREDIGWMEFTARKARFAADLAQASGYNGDLAAAMTDGRTVLHRVTIDGRPMVLTQATVDLVRQRRPGAQIAVGNLYHSGGDRLVLSGAELLKPDLNLVAGSAVTRDDLWRHLSLSQVQTIELKLAPPPPRSLQGMVQILALTAVALLALFLLACELWMETRGYALIAGGGLILSYLTWALFQTPLGPLALAVYLGGVALLTVELFKPSRRGGRGIAAFAAIGIGLGLTLLKDLPGLDPGWRVRHLPSEYWPTLGSAALVVAGSGLCATAIGLLAILRLKQTVRYRRRWRKRYENWDDSLFLTLQAQIGREGRTVTAIAPPATAEDNTNLNRTERARRRLAAPDREARFDVEGQSVGQVQIAGHEYAATCTGSIAADQPVVVVDCTEERLVVRYLPPQTATLAPWQTQSKYAADPTATKYTDAKPEPQTDLRTAAAPVPAPQVTPRYADTPADEPHKYPPKIEDTKYAKERKISGGSKYRPDDSTHGAP